MTSPLVYSEELVEKIIAGLEEGKGLRTICRDLNVNAPTVRRWATDDFMGFAARYARARDIGLDDVAENVIEIADGEGEAEDKRVRLDARKWYLSKIAPKRYGDRTEHVVETTHRFVLVAEVEQDQLTWQQQQNES